jgi:hypothetical protein
MTYSALPVSIRRHDRPPVVGSGVGLNIRTFADKCPNVKLDPTDFPTDFLFLLLPKNGCPNRASFSDAETAEIALSMFDLLGAPSNLISTIPAISVQPNAHDQAAHSTLQLRTPHNYRWRVLLILLLLLPLHAKLETGTLVPKQCDTDNAIQSVITFENGCSLSTPFLSMLRQQLVERITVSGLISHTHPGPA